MRYLRLLLFILPVMLSVAQPVYTQTAANDSLNKTLKQLPDSLRIDVFLSLAEELRLSDPRLSFEYGRQALELSSTLNDPLLTGRSYMSLAGIYILWSEYDKALTYLLPAHDEFEKSEAKPIWLFAVIT